MQYETTQQSQGTGPYDLNKQLGTSADAIKGKLQDGASLLDFVAKNSPGYRDPAGVVGQEIQKDVDAMATGRGGHSTTPDSTAPVKPTNEEIIPDVVTAEEDLLDETPALEGEGDKPKESGGQGGDLDAEEGEEELVFKGNAAENFKKLRTKYTEVKNESTKKDKLLQEVTQELEKYSKGEKLPEELVRREERIAELEHYEKLLNLKKSRYYQDNFVKPLDGIRGRLEKLAGDYGVDARKIIQAANLQNEADLNKFLSSNFDVVGANEVKGIVNEYKSLQSRAVEAEKEPAQALNSMIEAASTAREHQQRERLEVMQDISRNAWRESLDYIKDEGKIRELMHREGDTEHNSKIFTPIVRAAATEYGKLVSQLAKNGLENLPKDLAYALSRLCQLAHASAVSIESRERAVAMAEQIESNSQRTQRYVRPSLSGKIVSGTNGTGAKRGPSSPMEAAEALLRQVRGL